MPASGSRASSTSKGVNMWQSPAELSIVNAVAKQPRPQAIGVVGGDAIDFPVKQALPVRSFIDGPGQDADALGVALLHQSRVEERKVGTVELGIRLAGQL